MIADRKRLLRGAHEALRALRGDPDVVPHIRFIPSSGCVFCDLKIEPTADGFHRGKHQQIKCTRE